MHGAREPVERDQAVVIGIGRKQRPRRQVALAAAEAAQEGLVPGHRPRRRIDDGLEHARQFAAEPVPHHAAVAQATQLPARLPFERQTVEEIASAIRCLQCRMCHVGLLIKRRSVAIARLWGAIATRLYGAAVTNRTRKF